MPDLPTSLAAAGTKRAAALDHFHAILHAAVSDPSIWGPIELAAIDYAHAAAMGAVDGLMARIRGAGRMEAA